jgi:extracellular factor (EF) 3-hydroxypalmitic acid methyl ester biosynthesis protein
VLPDKIFYPSGMSQTSNGSANHGSKSARLPATVKATHVTFRNAEGAEFRGSLVRVTRHAVFFELHNPPDVPMLSAALEKFQIIFQDQVVYAGRAVVRSLVNTGLVVTCEVTLNEAEWTDVNPIMALQQNGHLIKEFRTFLNEWQNFYKLLPEYKIIIADMHTFLSDARLWLEQAEVGVRNLPASRQTDRQREIAGSLEPVMVTAIRTLFERFEDVSNRVDRDLVAPHNAFGKRLVLPLLLASPFVHRTLTKPLGYAGDYEMVNMMFCDPFSGPSLFGKMVNLYALQLPPIVAHRNRIDYLQRTLQNEALRVAAKSGEMKVFNMGCGPAQEVQRFIASSELANRAHFTLVDFNDETLAYTLRLLGDLKRRHARRTGIRTVKKAVHMLVKSVHRADDFMRPGQYDLIYCAGLFDYLNDLVCQQMMDIFYELLAPGGLLVATNVDSHPARNQMECFLEWNLIYRDNRGLRAVAPQKATDPQMAIKRDPSGVNVFLEVRKPEREK